MLLIFLSCFFPLYLIYFSLWISLLDDQLMFVGVLRLRRKRTKPSKTVGVDVLGDPKMMKFDFVYGYAQILITEGFHQFYYGKSVRRGAPR